MSKPTILAAFLLLRLTFFCAKGELLTIAVDPGGPRCDQESYFVVEVDIQPTIFGFSCDGPKDKLKLERLIQRVTERRFKKYLDKTNSLKAVQLEKFCGGDVGTSDRRALRNAADTANRRDLRSPSKMGNGFNFVTSSKCRFCPPGTSMSWWLSYPIFHSGTFLVLFPCIPSHWFPLSNRIAVDNMDDVLPIDGAPVTSSATPQEALQAELQKRIKRALTREVNRNVRVSCLVGSKSTVTVNLTAVGNHQPTLECPEDWYATVPKPIHVDTRLPKQKQYPLEQHCACLLVLLLVLE